jgi:hypothetical protein
MKRKKIKLHLNKETVVNLNHDELEKLKAGIGIQPITTTRPYTDTWLECCGPIWVTYPTMTLCGELHCP